MKNLYAAIVLLIFTTSYCQQLAIRGLVKDAATNQPVESASVAVENSGNGSITNEEGIFQLTVSNNATIVISYLGYKTQKIAVTEFKDGTKTILLEQNDEMIEEIMVTKIPLYQILNEAVNNSKARFNRPIVLNTYYREFSKSDRKYTKFSDGLLDYHISGNKKKTQSDMIVKQNRSFSLVSETDNENNDEQIGSLLSVQKGIYNSYDFAIITKYLIEDENYENYDFEMKSKKDKSGSEMFTIFFNPKAEVEKALFKGSVTFDPETKTIFEVEMNFAPSHQQYAKTVNVLVMRLSVTDVKFKAVYKLVGNNYMLSYNNRYTKIKAWTKKQSETIESRSDLLVTNYAKDNLEYSRKDLFKKKHLYEKPTQYTDKFWQKNNAIVLTAEEERIIDALEKATAATPN